ncbi:hypothetical protein [Robertkochia solimangrovi]|nr:hypothetical protein [Robertkochia solimangrovi]
MRSELEMNPEKAMRPEGKRAVRTLKKVLYQQNNSRHWRADRASDQDRH